MTTAEFEQEVEKAGNRAKKYLQIPPIVKAHEDQQIILSKNPLMEGFSDSCFVITDITFGMSDNKRCVAIRQPDGTLEIAPYEIKKRMCQVYHPSIDRKISTPKMFEAEYLQKLLDNHEYEFILDRACNQFEPYETEFHNITSTTYQHINTNKAFDILRSTRHFGAMAFFLTWHKMIDDLLVDFIKKFYIRNGAELIMLFYKLHAIPEEQHVGKVLEKFPDSRDVVREYCNTMLGRHDELHKRIDYGGGQGEEVAMEAFLEVIENYSKTHGVKKIQVEQAVQSFREVMEQKFGKVQRSLP